jgi:hypothetical protein
VSLLPETPTVPEVNSPYPLTAPAVRPET